ncbi:hypothetical protein [Luteimonas sp. YGD11-2]|uniref:hypothetical protein n=1 Tax=Luteimonas sp. YGD11-2 TaxID=2508168 RepID=UPI00100AB1C1|nr:hypothetical protein [Luteimonas sp. YGD11-2]
MPCAARLRPLLLVPLLAGCAGHPSIATVDADVSPPARTTHDPRLRASVPRAPAVPSPVAVPLDARTLSHAARRPIAIPIAGQTLRCVGVALIDLLRTSGAAPMDALHGPHLARYVLAQARDGRRVLFSLAELAPAGGSRAVAVVDTCDHDLGIPDDALLLLVDGRLDDARTLTGLHTLTVVVAP